MNRDSYIMTKNLASLLKLISDKNRFSLLSVLQTGSCCVSELIAKTRLSQSLISHHLKDLKGGKLVVDKKEGRWVNYALTAKGKQVMKVLKELSL